MKIEKVEMTERWNPMFVLIEEVRIFYYSRKLVSIKDGKKVGKRTGSPHCY